MVVECKKSHLQLRLWSSLCFKAFFSPPSLYHKPVLAYFFSIANAKLPGSCHHSWPSASRQMTLWKLVFFHTQIPHSSQSQFHRRRTSLWIICLQVALSLIVTNTQGSVPRPAASLLSPEVKTQQNIPAMLVRWRNLSAFFFPPSLVQNRCGQGREKNNSHFVWNWV